MHPSMIPHALNTNAASFVPGYTQVGQAPMPGMMTFRMPAAAPTAMAAPTMASLMPCSSGMLQTIMVQAGPTAPTTTAIVQAGTTTAPAAAPQVDMTEVLAAVETLYRDELRPFGRILRKRLAERAMAMGLGAIDVDVKRLRMLCESCPWLFVQSEEGGDWSALLRDRPQTFVDVYSPVDMYPQEMWREAAAYFGSLDEVYMALPGGRYSCAQVLAGRRLPFLAGLSLGKVSHVVQLAISQKKLLGYLNGAVVPYARSQSMLKEQCAEQRMACKNGKSHSNFATWDMLRAFLQETLRTLSPGTGSIPLSNVKRLFRSQKHVELSETALGYAKLSEALQDARVKDVCTVRLQGHGYAVFPSVPAVQRAPISIADNLPPYQSTAGVAAIECVPNTFSQNTFSQATNPQSVPAVGSSLRHRASWVPELSMEEIAAPEASAGTVDLQLSTPSARPLSRTGNTAPNLPVTPSPKSARAGRNLPKLLGSRIHAWAGGPNGVEPWKAADAVARSLAEEVEDEEEEEQEHIADPQQLWPATPMTPPSMWSKSIGHGMLGHAVAPPSETTELNMGSGWRRPSEALGAAQPA